MSVKKILDSMDYGVAPESAGEAKKWLLKHNSSFGHFIGGALTSPKLDLNLSIPLMEKP